jgi:hypothetical protein
MSTSYQRFVDEYLNATSWPERKDGVPLELLDQLDPSDKEKAEDELIHRLSSWRDDWPIQGLGHLQSQKALPFLYRLLPRSFGSVKAQIATAIWKICGDERMLRVVIGCSRRSIFSWLNPFKTFSQIDIIYCLAQFPQPEAKFRLEELSASSDFLVSYNAKRVLRMRSNSYGR